MRQCLQVFKVFPVILNRRLQCQQIEILRRHRHRKAPPIALEASHLVNHRPLRGDQRLQIHQPRASKQRDRRLHGQACRLPIRCIRIQCVDKIHQCIGRHLSAVRQLLLHANAVRDLQRRLILGVVVIADELQPGLRIELRLKQMPLQRHVQRRQINILHLRAIIRTVLHPIGDRTKQPQLQRLISGNRRSQLQPQSPLFQHFLRLCVLRRTGRS